MTMVPGAEGNLVAAIGKLLFGFLTRRHAPQHRAVVA